MKKGNNREVEPMNIVMFMMLAGFFPTVILFELRNYPNSIWAGVWLIIAMLAMLVGGVVAWAMMIREVIIPTIKKLLEMVKPHE